MPKFRKIDRKLDEAGLVWTKTDGTKYDFNCFAVPLKFIAKIYDYEITLDEAIEDQTKSKILINKLNNDYTPRIPKKADEKNMVLECAIKWSDARDEIINLFKKGIFLYKDNTFKTKEEGSEEESEKERFKKIIKHIEDKSKNINFDLFKDYFDHVVPSALAKKLFETKDKKENSELLELIKVRWSSLKDETEKMSKEEIKTEKPHKILEIVK